MILFRVINLVCLFLIVSIMPIFASDFIKADVRQGVVDALVLKHGTQDRARMNVCVAQVALYWEREDGSPDEFSQFCLENFIVDKVELKNFEAFLEKSIEEWDFSYVHKMILRQTQAKPTYYKLFSLYRPEFYFSEDLFSSKAAFVVLLNYPVVSLEDMSRKSYFWMKDFTRENWATFRLAGRFSSRIPAKILKKTLESASLEKDFSNSFAVQKEIDSFSKINGTFLARTFNEVVEIPENKYENMLKNILTDKSSRKVYNLLKEGLSDETRISHSKLTRITSEKYENISDLSRDLNVILLRLGFSKSNVDFLSDNIIIQSSEKTGVDFYKSAGNENAFLFINLTSKGLSYDEYKSVVGYIGEGIAHIYSTYNMDSYFLRGFPNDSFPLAFAEIFMLNTSESLGIVSHNDQNKNYFILSTFWNTWVESFASLHSIYMWRWMYANSDATDDEIKRADENIWKSLYSAYFLPVIDDDALWSEIKRRRYTCSQDFNKPLTGVIACQLLAYVKDKNLAQETERMCATGRVTPDIWMQRAVGADISYDSMSAQVSDVLKSIKENVDAEI